MGTKGVILAGGKGSRLFPLTQSISKQLLPIYNKPLIYYPLTTLMLAGVREIAVVTAPSQKQLFEKLLGDGSQFGVEIEFFIQPEPLGIPQALTITAQFIKDSATALILGDNLFHGVGLGRHLESFLEKPGATGFCFQVRNPEEFGIVTFDNKGEISSIIEKPKNSDSNLAIAGLYFFDKNVADGLSRLTPSSRGELEILDLLDHYRSKGQLKIELLPRGTVWLDTGTFDGLHDAAAYVKTIEDRTGFSIGDPVEVARVKNWI
jgi:glucose-1-phosphate thymidylyltransferase